MSAVDYLMNARADLDALAALLSSAAESGLAVSDIAGEALVLLNDARSTLEVIGDEEGTE